MKKSGQFLQEQERPHLATVLIFKCNDKYFL